MAIPNGSASKTIAGRPGKSSLPPAMLLAPVMVSSLLPGRGTIDGAVEISGKIKGLAPNVYWPALRKGNANPR
jgi:hypothetical protein